MGKDAKRCSVCQQEKLVESFYKSKKDQTLRPACIDCSVALNKKYYAKHKHKYVHKRRAYNLKAYNLSVQDYEDLLASQENKCAICRGSNEKYNRRLFVDHCHRTGEIRGLLCLLCNSLLGQAENTINAFFTLESAIKYLRKFRGP